MKAGDMQQLTFRLPRLGGAESEARILAWKKSPGDSFNEGDTLLEVETDKAVVDVPAPAAGRLVRHLAQVDAYAAFDEGLAEIELPASDAHAYLTSIGHSADAAPALPQASGAGPAPVRAQPAVAATSAGAPGRVVATPVARKIAAQAGVSLEGVQGSGPRGRIVRDDVARLVARPPSASGPASRAQESQVPVGDGAVFVRRWQPPAGEAGEVTTVLLHGLFGDVETWSGLAAGLVERGGPVVALDLPVHGRTTASARTLDEAAQLLAAVLAELVPGPKVLVGHSFGGALAIKLARMPTVRDVRALALIAPAGCGTEINQGFLLGMLHAANPALLRRELDKLAQRLPSFGDDLVAQLHASLRSHGAGLSALVEGFAVQGAQQIDLRASLDDIAVPVSVLWGRLDQVIPWTHALNITPRAALHLFPDAGHMPQWECGSVVAEVLGRVLDRARFR